MNIGKVSQVIGVVVDVEFEKELPDILHALKIDEPGDAATGIPEMHLTLETVAHLGDNKVKTLAMGSTDGLIRGMKVLDTGQPITVPVGKAVLGRLINVLGEPIDELGPVEAEERLPIHRLAPDF
ncbi:MAG: F0F1 ATP synthase subunit beta, partial [Nitrospirae bacterium]|nr:F0F1 ATP synthase subunit beta [Nitrospirota bacterium]